MASTIEKLVEPKLLKILRLFIGSDELFHLNKIADRSKVPIGTAFRIMKKLREAGVVEVIVVGKIKLYRAKSQVSKELRVLI